MSELTVEQVENAIYSHCKFYEGGEVDAQAIADELNAALGVEECEIVTTEGWLPVERYHRCKICGAFFAVNACPNCGRW